MTLYEILLFVHILAVVVWVGGTITFHVIAQRALGSGDAARIGTVAGDIDWVGLRVYTPAAVIALASGVWMVLEGDIGFGRGWVVAGLAGFTFSFLVGSLYNGPRSRKLHELIAAHGGGAPEVRRLIGTLLLAGRIELAVLLFVIFNMAAKPWD